MYVFCIKEGGLCLFFFFGGGGGGGGAAPPNPPAALFGSRFHNLGQLIWKKSSAPCTCCVSI